MSAELMRRASVRIRHDVEYGQAHGDDAFLVAVADWLDKEADNYHDDASTSAALAVARAYLGERA